MYLFLIFIMGIMIAKIIELISGFWNEKNDSQGASQRSINDTETHVSPVGLFLQRHCSRGMEHNR